MQNFRTVYKPSPGQTYLGYANHWLTAGSCFANCMEIRLSEAGFKTSALSLGTVYNPVILFNLLNGRQPFNPDLILNRNDVWLHYGFGERMYGYSKLELEHKLATLENEKKQAIQTSDVWLLTLGTAWVYELNQFGNMVGNCHKMPTSMFSRRLLEVDEIVNAFSEMLDNISKKPQIILTVSPVRHTRDTLPLNAVSKAVLRLACHKISALYPQVGYFPAFEILTDDLRDYRFYSDDLIHPTQAAETYIWNQFADTWFSHETKQIIAQYNQLKASVNHRPQHLETANYKQHIETTLQQLQALSQRYPFLNLETERQQLNTLIGRF